MMNRCVNLRQLFRHLCRRGFCLVVCALASGLIFGEALAQQKGAGVRFAANPRGERRVALVIGNSNYTPEIGRLKNPINDASDMATALRSLDFEIIGGKAHLDVNLRQMADLVRTFGREIRQGGVGVFYFSGHGIQVNRHNYLLPLGAHVEKEQDVPFEAFDVDRVLAEMEAAENNLNILILDACRNNPLMRSFRSGGKGLARPESVPIGTYIAFAARDGQTASDNAAGRNGLYTQELLKNIGRPGLRLEDIFINTRREVRRLSQNAQIPVEYGSIDAPFFLSESAVTTGLRGTSTPPPKRVFDTYRGDVYVDRGRYNPATTDPALAYFNRGTFNKNKGFYDLAIADYSKVLALNPKDAGAYINRGLVYRSTNEFERAIADYTRAIELDPKDAFAIYNRGNVYVEKQEYARAIADYTRAIELNPDFASAYFNRAHAYSNEGDYYLALDDYNKVVGFDPQDAAAYFYRGVAHYGTQGYDLAMADYTRAIELDPKFADAYISRGIYYYDKQNYNRAIADYTCAIELNPKDPSAYRYRAKAYDAKGDGSRAAADQQKVADLMKKQP